MVLQVAALTNVRLCYGIEKADYPAECAEIMDREFQRWMRWYGKSYSDYNLEKGDFLETPMNEKINQAA